MMRKAIRGHIQQNPDLECILPYIKQNVGFVFTDNDLTEMRDKILANKVPAAARAGALAPVSCTVPAQVTALGPEKTSFFQALQIPTKISRGNIEILVRSYIFMRNLDQGLFGFSLLWRYLCVLCIECCRADQSWGESGSLRSHLVGHVEHYALHLWFGGHSNLRQRNHVRSEGAGHH